MPTIIAFRSVTRGAGASTLAATFAKETAVLKQKVLLVEANLISPSFAANTGVSHSTKNFLNLVNQGNESYKITNFIASPEDVDNKKLAAQLNGMDVLVVPRYQGKLDQIKLENPSQWIEKFMNTLKELPYDYIVIDVPTELDEFTSYPILSASDEVINVVDNTPKSVIEYRNEKIWLKENSLEFKEILVINKHEKDYQGNIYELINDTPYIPIPYDPLRSREEWLLKIGSDLINVKIQILQNHIGVQGVGYQDKSRNKGGLLTLLGLNK
ncbi:AAA family ATPase [Exiguobacterium artemiae]|uniref:AAA family ATPase n=1 Tax=Exiguobacterium artemiae TaxID=340145 RepID=UPI00047E2082|nr:AAA family ATPase [Exiguobacterium sibiricum]